MQAAQQVAQQAPQFHPIWNSVPTLVWASLLLVVLLLFQEHIRSLLTLLHRRLVQGAGIKLGSFEIGRAYVSPGGSVKAGGLHSIREDDGQRHRQREDYYVPNRNIMLVHRIAPSVEKDQLYDVLLYVVAHPKSNASLLEVTHVEYYFGKSWKSQIFTSIDRARGFAVATSCYGPFMCTAKIHFNDAVSVMVARYVDFEMGAVGPDPEPPQQRPA